MQTKATAGACVEPARAAAVNGGPSVFRRDCVALDSWANVHLMHRKKHGGSQSFEDTLTLAGNTTAKGKREVGPKGVPRMSTGVKGMKKGGTKPTKVPTKPPFELQGTPTRFQREPKMVTRGTQGHQR